MCFVQTFWLQEFLYDLTFYATGIEDLVGYRKSAFLWKNFNIDPGYCPFAAGFSYFACVSCDKAFLVKLKYLIL